MAKKSPAPPAAPGAAAPKKKPMVPLSTIITFVIAVPIGYWAFTSYKKWSGIRAEVARINADRATLLSRNTELAKVYDNVAQKKYQICNKSADIATINWVAAAYHDGKTIKIFDSDQCQDFKPIVMQPGDDKSVLLRSSQPGCNWDGSVFYYAMRYTLESEERTNSFNVVGPYQGFDRDCYNVQG
jgi:hypothetical protein